MTDTKQHILYTLAYFDIFHYPLLKEELLRFHHRNIDQGMLETAIAGLLQEQHIYKLGEFYSLHNDNQLATNRRRGNQLAALQMPTAYKAAKILSRFPYVKGVAVSGSLSKNCSTPTADIDFFIITAPNRLWIARTIMHAYKKLSYLTGRKKWFCMNYYVDEAAMQIEEQNIFTAMEMATLLPMYGKATLDNCMADNKWIADHFPAAANDTGKVPEIKKSIFARFLERLFNTRLGNRLDDSLMRITQQRWQAKARQQKKNDHGFTLAMRVNKHCSKPDPVFFQHKVLEMYQAKLHALPDLQHTTIKAG